MQCYLRNMRQLFVFCGVSAACGWMMSRLERASKWNDSSYLQFTRAALWAVNEAPFCHFIWNVSGWTCMLKLAINQTWPPHLLNVVRPWQPAVSIEVPRNDTNTSALQLMGWNEDFFRNKHFFRQHCGLHSPCCEWAAEFKALKCLGPVIMHSGFRCVGGWSRTSIVLFQISTSFVLTFQNVFQKWKN